LQSREGLFLRQAESSASDTLCNAMPNDQDLIQALKNFREDILKALTQIEIEVTAIEMTIAETDMDTKTRLTMNREEARKQMTRIRERLAETVAPAHETR
jgi:Holliday junction resolvasome RuvABC endonuclease subunit